MSVEDKNIVYIYEEENLDPSFGWDLEEETQLTICYTRADGVELWTRIP